MCCAAIVIGLTMGHACPSIRPVLAPDLKTKRHRNWCELCPWLE